MMMTTNIRIDDKLSYLMVIVLSCFLFINTFSRSSIESLIVIGEMTIDLTLFFMIVMLIRSWLRRTFLPISLFNLYIVMFLMGFMFFLSFLISPYMTEWAE